MAVAVDQGVITGMSDAEEPSAEFIFTEIKSRLSYQDGQINMLDTKANFVLASASALVLAAAAMFREIGAANENTLWWTETVSELTAGRLLMVGIAGLFSITLVMAGLAYKVRKWHVSPNPRTLVSDYWTMTLGQTRSDYIAQLVYDFEVNEKDVNAKSLWLKCSFLALIGEAACVVAMASIQI